MNSPTGVGAGAPAGQQGPAAGLLPGRVAVVTGGAAGIGLAIARTFVDAGARVVLADVDGAAADRAAAQLGPENAVGIACDVTDEDAVTAVAERAVEVFDGLDVWVNNAGFTRDAVMRKMTVADFTSVLTVHLTGSWLGVRAATAVMRRLARPGAIVNMSSISGKVGNPGQTNYSAAKAGLVGLTKAAAKEIARYGIRVNAVQPGLIDTPMTARMPPDVLAAQIAQVPLGRIGSTTDVANAVLFLAGDLSAYLTGTVLEVTGGRNM